MTDEPAEVIETHPEPEGTPEAAHPYEAAAETPDHAADLSSAETVADVAVPEYVPPAEPEATSEGEPAAEGEPGVEAEVPSVPVSNKRWYAVKVQSGREESIKAAIERRVKIEGLEEYFAQIVIPVERKVTVKDGRRVTRKTKKLPGYLMAEVEFNDQILYLFRETSGVGDFVGHNPILDKKPLPMTDDEVRNMLSDESAEGAKDGAGGATKSKGKVAKAPTITKGDRVRVRDGTFADMEGTVKDIIEPADPKNNYRIRVELTIWGRPTPVELDPLQVEPV